MSDEISRRLEEAARAHGAEAETHADVARIAASVIGPARRRRRATGAATFAAACAAVAVFAGGSLAVMGALRGADVGPATHEGTPVIMSDAPLPTPQGGSDSPTSEQGKPITEYPPVAPSRGEGFPVAFEMRDWVWDYVGNGWSLQSYSASQGLDAKRHVTIPEATIYLVSPDGAAFELVTLPPEYSGAMRVASWQEDERGAHIVWDGDNTADPAVPAGAGVLDLTTGSVSPLVFSTPWGVSSTVTPLAASATGNELWAAFLGGHQRFYRYGTADGWTVAAVNDLESIGDRTADHRWDTAELVGDRRLVTRPDSAAVLFERRPWRNGPLEEFAVYNVNSGALVRSELQFSFPIEPDVVCTVTAWIGDSELSYDCGGKRLSFFTVVPVTGGSATAEYGEAVISGSKSAVLRTSTVGYREATSVSYLANP